MCVCVCVCSPSLCVHHVCMTVCPPFVFSPTSSTFPLFLGCKQRTALHMCSLFGHAAAAAALIAAGADVNARDANVSGTLFDSGGGGGGGGGKEEEVVEGRRRWCWWVVVEVVGAERRRDGWKDA